MKRRLLLPIIMCIFVAGLPAVYMLSKYQNMHQHFTTEKWNRYNWNDRQFLIHDFIKQHDLYVMTRDEIIEMLGDEPDFYDQYAIPNKTSDNLVYNFGEYKMGNFIRFPGNITFVIEFNNDGYVKEYRLFTYKW